SASISFGITSFFNDATVVPGVAYRYTIYARSSQVSGTPTAAQNATTPLGAPSALVVTGTDVNAVGLSWTGTLNASNYLIEHSLIPDGGFVSAGATDGGTFVDTTVAGATRYFFQVRGQTADVPSGPASNQVDAIALLATPN